MDNHETTGLERAVFGDVNRAQRRLAQSLAAQPQILRALPAITPAQPTGVGLVRGRTVAGTPRLPVRLQHHGAGVPVAR